MSICKHASSTPPVPKSVKTVNLMFPNLFSSIITVTMQFISTLQSMKLLNLYFFFLIVFTGRRTVSLFHLYSGGGWSAKRYRASFPQHSLTFSFNPFFHTAVSFKSEIIESEPRPPLRKIGFSDQIRIKFEL